MHIKNFFLVIILLLAGCVSPEPSENAIRTAIAQTQAAQQLASPQPRFQTDQDIPPAIETTTPIGDNQLEATPSPSTAESPCEAEKWEFVPIGLYEYPDRDGWKILVIPFVTYNGSSYWGQLRITRNMIESETSITTEGGFVYPIHRTMNDILKLPVEPTNSPYSGAYEVPSLIISDTVLPPGFFYRGDHFVGGEGPTLSGAPTKWQQLVFRVPETQTHFRVQLPSAKVNCFKEDGKVSSDKPPSYWDLDNDVRTINLPTDRPSSEFQDILGIPVTKGQSVFEFKEVSRADLWTNELGNEELDLFFSLQNTNQGYELEDGIGAYVIGDDGIRRSPGCGLSRGCVGIEGIGESGRIKVGPGQIKEANLAFVIDPNLRNLKLVWTDMSENFFVVFNLPDEE